MAASVSFQALGCRAAMKAVEGGGMGSREGAEQKGLEREKHERRCQRLEALLYLKLHRRGPLPLRPRPDPPRPVH